MGQDCKNSSSGRIKPESQVPSDANYMIPSEASLVLQRHRDEDERRLPQARHGQLANSLAVARSATGGRQKKAKETARLRHG